MSEQPDSDARPVAAVVILAAGPGKRMRSARSKLLHEVAGHSLLSYAVSAATNLQPERIVVVVGHGRDQVEAHLEEIAPHVTTAVQEQPLGTGHAVRVALERLGEVAGEVVVTYGDVPMLASETLAALLEEHRRRQAAVTVLTAEVPDPTGYGRILRDADGAVQSIIEHRDADEAQRAIHEINSGVYVFAAETLQSALTELTPDNDQGELYLTDVLGLARRDGRAVASSAAQAMSSRRNPRTPSEVGPPRSRTRRWVPAGASSAPVAAPRGPGPGFAGLARAARRHHVGRGRRPSIVTHPVAAAAELR